MSVDELQSTDWHKTSYSGGHDDAYVADLLRDVTPVRDSSGPRNPVLAFLAPGWAAYVAAVVGGELRGY